MAPAVVNGLVVGAIVGVPVFLTTVKVLGFRPAGIVAGSAAAAIMTTYGGAVSSGSTLAVLQSIGAAGLSTAGTVIVTAASAAAGAAVTIAGKAIAAVIGVA